MKPRILIIDDQPEFVNYTSDLFTQLIPGCRVRTALSGTEGMKQARREAPDVILLDVAMPKMDGYQVCRQLKSDEATRRIPVIFITGLHTDTRSRIKGLEAGGDAFLNKPIEPAELVAQVKAMLRIKRSEDDLRRQKELLENTVAERTRLLRESEQKYRQFFTEDLTADFISDAEGQILECNPAFIRLFDIGSPSRTPRLNIGSLCASSLSMDTLIAHLKTRRKAIHRELEMKTAHGKALTAEINLVGKFDRDGNLQTMIGYISDISERRHAENLLMQEQHYLQSILRAAPIGIGVVVNRHFKYVNEQFTVMVGYSKEELIGKNARLIYPDNDEYKRVGRVKYRQIRQKGTGTIETRFRRKDGAIIDVLLSSTAISQNFPSPEITFTVLDITERKRTKQALEENRQRLQALSHHLLEVQENERRSIARELHDEIGQSLTMIKITLDTLKNQSAEASARQSLNETLQLIGRTLEQVRSLSLSLRPSLLDDLGLVPALRWFLDKHRQRSGLSIQFTADASIRNLPPGIQIASYRIVQEALTNILRHANATRVIIKLQKGVHSLVLRIRDNGRGFDVAAARRKALGGGSLGLLGMEERAEFTGGRFRIQSTPGQGTRIDVRFPLSPG